MKHLLPWRMRRFISDACPLFYHLCDNLFRSRRSEDYWDQRLAETWHLRTWPTKNDLIAGMTRPDQTILDIACGNGSILRDLKARGYGKLHGLEISRYAVRRLSEEGFAMHQGKVPTLPLPNDTFDVVIASQVLEHIIRRGHFAREIQRVLRPGGAAFIFVPDNCLGPIDEPEHVIKYDALSLRRFLGRHFDVVSLQSLKDANHEMPILFALVRNRAAAA